MIQTALTFQSPAQRSAQRSSPMQPSSRGAHALTFEPRSSSRHSPSVPRRESSSPYTNINSSRMSSASRRNGAGDSYAQSPAAKRDLDEMDSDIEDFIVPDDDEEEVEDGDGSGSEDASDADSDISDDRVRRGKRRGSSGDRAGRSKRRRGSLLADKLRELQEADEEEEAFIPVPLQRRLGSASEEEEDEEEEDDLVLIPSSDDDVDRIYGDGEAPEEDEDEDSSRLWCCYCGKFYVHDDFSAQQLRTASDETRYCLRHSSTAAFNATYKKPEKKAHGLRFGPAHESTPSPFGIRSTMPNGAAAASSSPSGGRGSGARASPPKQPKVDIFARNRPTPTPSQKSASPANALSSSSGAAATYVPASEQRRLRFVSGGGSDSDDGGSQGEAVTPSKRPRVINICSSDEEGGDKKESNDSEGIGGRRVGKGGRSSGIYDGAVTSSGSRVSSDRRAVYKLDSSGSEEEAEAEFDEAPVHRTPQVAAPRSVASSAKPKSKPIVEKSRNRNDPAKRRKSISSSSEEEDADDDDEAEWSGSSSSSASDSSYASSGSDESFDSDSSVSDSESSHDHRKKSQRSKRQISTRASSKTRSGAEASGSKALNSSRPVQKANASKGSASASATSSKVPQRRGRVRSSSSSSGGGGSSSSEGEASWDGS